MARIDFLRRSTLIAKEIRGNRWAEDYFLIFYWIVNLVSIMWLACEVELHEMSVYD